MRELGLQGQQPTKKRRTTNSEHPFPRYPNLVEHLEIVRPSLGYLTPLEFEQQWLSQQASQPAMK